jgi:hypothetical protein
MPRRSWRAAVRPVPLKLTVVDRGCAIGPCFAALAQPRDEALLAELASALSLWSRPAGEWW